MSFTYVNVNSCLDLLAFTTWNGSETGGYITNMSAEKQEEGVKHVSFMFEFVRLEHIYRSVYMGSLKDDLEISRE